MTKQPVNKMLLSSERKVPCKRLARTDSDKNLPIPKRPRQNLLAYSTERMAPQESNSSMDASDTSSNNFPAVESNQQLEVVLDSNTYDPNGFTSDELNPIYEWTRNTAPHEKYGIDVCPMLRNILRPFPKGLRLIKLETMMWHKYRINLLAVSQELGCNHSLELLQVVPGIIITFKPKKPLRHLVQLDPAGDKVSN